MPPGPLTTPSSPRGLRPHEQRLGDDLVRAGHVSAEQLREAVERAHASGRPLRRVLVEAELVDDATLLAVDAERHQLEIVDLTQYPIDPEAVVRLPRSVCLRYGALPIGCDGQQLVVALTDPASYVPVEQEVQRETGLAARMMLAAPAQVRDAIRDHLDPAGTGEDVELVLEASGGADEDDTDEAPEAPSPDAEASASATLNTILSTALARRASDVHLEPSEHFVRIRLRVDGVLEDTISLPSPLLAALVTRIKVAARLDIGEKRLPQDGNIVVKVAGRSVDLRVNTLPTIWGERVVMRILDGSTGPRSLESTGLEPDDAARLKQALDAHHGVTLVTGPTGSGKTTTLYAALQYLAKPGVNVLTVEDPVEYKMQGISQVQVHRTAGLDFAKALEAFLRQDPDVILLGEIRSEETAQVALTASMTGHKVLSTLHMHSAAEALTRLIEMGVKQYVVGSTLRAVLAQRLIRRVCEHCKVEDTANAERAAALGVDADGLRRGAGCERCGFSGTSGRTAIHELLVVDEALRDAILSDATAHEVERIARAGGMRTLAESALLKVARGISSFDEVLPYLQELEPADG